VDCIVLDLQHGFHDESSALAATAEAASRGVPVLARIPLDRWDSCQKLLDFGVSGVIAPMIDGGEEAAIFAASAKFPSLGRRSYAPRYAASVHGVPVNEYHAQANDRTLALAQVETREAYEHLDTILDTPGIDGILMGPSDFSISVNGGGPNDAYGDSTRDLVREIGERTRAKEKIAAAFCMQSDHVKLVEDAGYQLVSIALDTSLVQIGLGEVRARLK